MRIITITLLALAISSAARAESVTTSTVEPQKLDVVVPVTMYYEQMMPKLPYQPKVEVSQKDAYPQGWAKDAIEADKKVRSDVR